MSKRKAKDQFVLNVTAKDYKKEIARGVDPGNAMRPGKHVFRRVDPRRVAKPEDVDPRNIKLMLTLRVDADIVAFFKRRAEHPGAAGYQTQINDALRTFMEGGSETGDFSKLLKNENFIAAIAERLRQRA